jgi:tetratricopeptide (TPR) repeat protein
MTISAKLKSLSKPVFLLLLVLFCLAGCGTSPTLTKEQIDELKSKGFKLFQEEKYKEAIPLAQKAAQAAEKVYPKDSPDLADLYAGLARSLQGDKRYADAIASFEKAIAIYRTLPDKKRELARTLNFLGVCLAEYGIDDQALKVMFESVATYADAGLDSSVDCLEAVVNLAAVGIKNKKYKEAEDVMQIALKVCRNEPDIPPGIYANVLNNIGEVNFLRQDYDTALKYYQEAFDMAEKKMSSRSDVVAIYRKNVENAKGKLKK